jgi:hypothetical protein
MNAADRPVQYAYSFYNQEDLIHFSKLYLKYLPKDVNILLSSGSSGAAIASGILALAPRERRLGHWYIRKPHESYHRRVSAGVQPTFRSITCFVDDFISTGETLKRVHKETCIDYTLTWSVEFDLVELSHIVQKHFIIIKEEEMRNAEREEKVSY